MMEGKTLAVAVALVGLAGLGLGMAILFAGGPPPAPARPKLPIAPSPSGSDLRYSPTMYRALVEQDAKTLGVPVPSPGELSAIFPYFDERPAKPRLRVGSTIRSAHLRLSLVLRREEGAVEGQQSFRADHLVLEIENRTARPLAYRVTTRVVEAGRCEAKGVIEHNAVALRPRQTIARTECLFQKSASVDLVAVEVMEIPLLSYEYLSRLTPALVLYDARTAAGHTVGKGGPCPQTLSWREVRDGAARGDVEWRDIIDFYARHSCAEYAFYPGYRYRRDAAAPLPARPPQNP
jgi:hypothetical protein